MLNFFSAHDFHKKKKLNQVQSVGCKSYRDNVYMHVEKKKTKRGGNMEGLSEEVLLY